jgi:hypothetical protein
MLTVFLAIPAFEALLSMSRLWREARYWDMGEAGMLIIALAGMWLVFQQFMRNLDRGTEPALFRKLALPAWRIATLGGFGILLAERHLR